MKRKILILGFALVAVAFVMFYYLRSEGSAPKGQQPLVRLDSSNVVDLKEAFNGAANSVRVVVMLSPT
jgi:hypothetical protein